MGDGAVCVPPPAMSMQSLRGPAPGRMLPWLHTPTTTPFQSWTREARSLPEDHTQIPPCPTSPTATQPAASPPKRPLLPGPPCHQGVHQQLCGLDGPLHWEGPRGLGRPGPAQ